jgi:hypothetical protein
MYLSKQFILSVLFFVLRGSNIGRYGRTKKYMARADPKGGNQCVVGLEGRGGIKINSCSPPPPTAMNAPLPSQRQGSERACNLSVSSRPRVPNYTIALGRDRKEE